MAVPTNPTPPSRVYAYGDKNSGASGQVGMDRASGWVETTMRRPRIDGVAQSFPINCVYGQREQIMAERRGEGDQQVDVEVRVYREQNGCGATNLDTYTFDPVSGTATVSASVGAAVRTWTYVRPAGGGTWDLEDEKQSFSRVTIDLEWSASGLASPDSWACIHYTLPPTAGVCPKDYAAAITQQATVAGSIEFVGLGATLQDPASGEMTWGAFLP